MNWSDIGTTLKNILMAMLRGELLLRLKFDKYFIHILWFFALFTLAIWINMGVERRMELMQKNKAELETITIRHSQTTCELEKLKRINTIEKILSEKESKVGIPEKPANRIK